MSLIKVITKKGCSFCAILKAQLDNLGVPYEEVLDNTSPVAPIIRDSLTGQVIYKGLPKRSKLINILEKLNYDVK